MCDCVTVSLKKKNIYIYIYITCITKKVTQIYMSKKKKSWDNKLQVSQIYTK